ncbi:MAG TPA: DUF4476 domain-containing protein [Chitinophagaceae bacterium]
MKQLTFILLGVFLYAAVSAQTVTIRFEGTGNATGSNTPNYTVDLDGNRYYSSTAGNVGNAGIKQLVIEDLALGTHKLAVYRNSDNSNTIDNSTLLYSKNFELRAGYDMIIAVRRNGSVTFTEKKLKSNADVSGSNNPMTETEFNKLLQSVKVKWSQSSRYTAIKSALQNKSNYFTTDQVGQLLLIITSEARRLELAKLSYPKVTDPQNFMDVADLFNSQANKDNIVAFVESKNQDVVNAQGKPMNSQQFNRLLRRVQSQYDQNGRYGVLRDEFNITTNYFTTAQLRQLLSLISNETQRLELAKLSYARVSDPANFASLYNLFNSTANREELRVYTTSGGSIGTTGQYASRIAMTDADFNKLHLKARMHFRQSSTVSDIKEALSNKSNYFTVEQLRALLSLVTTESDRLILAKLAYHRAADPANFTQLLDLFTTQASVNELNNYIKVNPS